MGGLFGVASKRDCVADLFFGTDYHSHLGTSRGGLVVCEDGHFSKAIHNIENAPFRTKFSGDVRHMKGLLGIGSISDGSPQPLIVRAHFGNFVLGTVGRVNNSREILKRVLNENRGQLMEMSRGRVNETELVATIISSCDTLIDGMKAALAQIDGSLTMLVMTTEGIYAARDRYGRTSLTIGKNGDGYAVSMENFAYQNLDYQDAYELGPNEIVLIKPDGYETIENPGKTMKICTFLWTYYGYPPANYAGKNVEAVRYRCGAALARHDAGLEVDCVSGVPDSGIAHALGYANASGLPYARPLIKYTPTWPRSFMPPTQSMRQIIANMKLISIPSLIKDKRLLLVDDSIVRGTQTKKMADYLFEASAKEVHIRSACPPIMYGCKYLNFSRSTSEYDLIARRVVREIEGEHDEERLPAYIDHQTDEHREMVSRICEYSRFTSLGYHELEDMIDAVGIERCKLCTYCWDGKEEMAEKD
ncbi:amidophosphoribosyltransferase [Pseudoramibacter faecis]|uniref:amidophosphoribosyltransferase n=1 Tax=Pseudoramibacter faecis TaxID=3108534 RepID=UPI002E7775BC|nr:amidophosphoribosyltransferase [Pseudoramibacter sp. HA2172]